MNVDPRERRRTPADETGEIPVAPGKSLDSWLVRDWDDGIHIDGVEELHALRVITRNNAYELTVLHGGEGNVLVRGGRFFPDWTRAQFLGCSMGGALLKWHAIHPGMRMEFYALGRRIITSPVYSIAHVPDVVGS